MGTTASVSARLELQRRFSPTGLWSRLKSPKFAAMFPCILRICSVAAVVSCDNFVKRTSVCSALIEVLLLFTEGGVKLNKLLSRLACHRQIPDKYYIGCGFQRKQ